MGLPGRRGRDYPSWVEVRQGLPGMWLATGGVGDPLSPCLPGTQSPIACQQFFQTDIPIVLPACFETHPLPAKPDRPVGDNSQFLPAPPLLTYPLVFLVWGGRRTGPAPPACACPSHRASPFLPFTGRKRQEKDDIPNPWLSQGRICAWTMWEQTELCWGSPRRTGVTDTPPGTHCPCTGRMKRSYCAWLGMGQPNACHGATSWELTGWFVLPRQQPRLELFPFWGH